MKTPTSKESDHTEDDGLVAPPWPPTEIDGLGEALEKPRKSVVQSLSKKLSKKQAAPETPVEFSTVFASEMAVVAERRKARGLDACPLQGATQPGTNLELIGLSLSGGGIRSSSFSLGVLQALHHADLLRHFDYLSTVSGGGFIGATLSSLLHHSGGELPFSKARSADTPIVTHLRNRSSYLNPGGVLNGARFPALILRGLLLNVIAIVPVLLVAALVTEVWYTFTYNEQWLINKFYDPLAALLLLVPFLALLVVHLLIPRKNPDLRERYEKFFAGSFVLAIAGIAIFFVQRLVIFAIENGEFAEERIQIFSRNWLIFLFALPLCHMALRSTKSRLTRSVRGLILIAMSTVVPLCLLTTYLLVCINIIPNPMLQGRDKGPDAYKKHLKNLYEAEHNGARLSWSIHSWLKRHDLNASKKLKIKCSGKCEDLKTTEEMIKECTRKLPYCSSIGNCDSCRINTADIDDGCCWSVEDEASGQELKLTLWMDKRANQIHMALYEIPWNSVSVREFWDNLRGGGDRRPLILWSLLSLLSLLFFYRIFNANVLSLHGFYRDSLARVFVVRPRPGAPDEFEQAKGLKLSELERGKTEAPYGAPYPLINATLNVRGSEEGMLRYRKGVSFTFSPQFVGSSSTKYVATKAMETADEQLSLASAAAISAAAAGPNMGSFTSGWLSPLFTLLNLRLGYWLPHPDHVRVRWLPQLPGARYILKEALGLVNVKSKFVNVSDGGHFENLGVYELLRRRCRLIVAVDGERDPEEQARALSTLMRLARIDLGVTIECEIQSFRDREGEFEKQPWLWATIHYGEDENGKKMTGDLLYIKARVTGREPDYVYAYRKESPAFPHESTADQFFNEVQFECYRALGEHIGERVINESEVRDHLKK